jgi:hypothetical protein
LETLIYSTKIANISAVFQEVNTKDNIIDKYIKNTFDYFGKKKEQKHDFFLQKNLLNKRFAIIFVA